MSMEIESRLGEACRLRNPWDRPGLVSEDDGPAQELEGDVLRFGTKPAAYSVVLPNGTTAQGTLGRRR